MPLVRGRHEIWQGFVRRSGDKVPVWSVGEALLRGVVKVPQKLAKANYTATIMKKYEKSKAICL